MISALTERPTNPAEAPEFVRYYRFQPSVGYGGWMVYRLAGRLYRMWMGWQAAARLLGRAPTAFPVLREGRARA